jgi:hypothetical protein
MEETCIFFSYLVALVIILTHRYDPIDHDAFICVSLHLRITKVAQEITIALSNLVLTEAWKGHQITKKNACLFHTFLPYFPITIYCKGELWNFSSVTLLSIFLLIFCIKLDTDMILRSCAFITFHTF